MMPRLARILLVWFCCGQGFAAAAPPAIWLDVPFVKQEKNGCGAASTAMVMQYWRLRQGQPLDANASSTQIQRALYSAAAHGVYASLVEQYFRQNGFQTFAFPGGWADLKEHLEKGRPLMVAVKPGGAALHYVVVAGLDSDQGVVMLNDPARRKLLKQDRSSFEREWTAAGKWTLLALPQQGSR
jgi:ABC-type bacteriocin/lantibiotic exporter with double-glycine peptidase domain